MDIDHSNRTASSMPYHGQLSSHESPELRMRLEERNGAFGSDNSWPDSTRYRPSSTSSLSSSTTGQGLETSSFRPTSFTSLGSRVECPSLFLGETRDRADKSVQKDDRKGDSKKAHKESERDRRNIENACIQQLKSLTHSECYMNVKSKYRDEPAKNEILARANAFIMALVLRLNSELSQNLALEQKILDLQQELNTLRRKLDPRSVRLDDEQLGHHPNHTYFRRTGHPESSPRNVYVRPNVHTPYTTPSHCEAANCRYSVSHYEAWYDSDLCRGWLDGPDGVLARTLEIVAVWHEGITKIIKAFEEIQAAHPKIVPWNASALVGAFARIHAGNPRIKSWDTGRLVHIFEKSLAAQFTAEPSSMESWVNAMDRPKAIPPSGIS
ncbi:hypothetical protein MMC18_001072 [Xylographa bjoerkii]|nr:hypothetical protein [Xylographa bjoerkii]